MSRCMLSFFSIFVLALGLGAATPTSVPAWVDINSQIVPRIDTATSLISFTTTADGCTKDEELGGNWLLNTMKVGFVVVFR